VAVETNLLYGSNITTMCISLLHISQIQSVYYVLTHTTHDRFTAGLEYIRVHPGEQVPER